VYVTNLTYTSSSSAQPVEGMATRPIPSALVQVVHRKIVNDSIHG